MAGLMATALAFKHNWETERYALLNTRVCDLELRLEETLLYRCIQKLYDEMDRNGFRFKPPYYFSCAGDEWGCPDRVPIIGIPFYLADRRLLRIEQEMGYMRYDRKDLLLLLRHEAGHAVNYAYRLYQDPEWEEIFGDFNAKSPINFKYKFNPYSKSYVKSLNNPKYYAQAHPDEDFAETFSVWLTPRSNWRKVYGRWPAIRKLEYMDRTMKRIARKKPVVGAGYLDSPYDSKTYTLIEYYGRALARFKAKALGVYDEELHRIFSSPTNGHKRAIPASELIHKNRGFLLETISRWTGARDRVVAPVIGWLARCCSDLQLVQVPGRESHNLASLASLGTAIVMNYIHTGRYISD